MQNGKQSELIQREVVTGYITLNGNLKVGHFLCASSGQHKSKLSSRQGCRSLYRHIRAKYTCVYFMGV